MIKHSTLVPGRVLTLKRDYWYTDDKGVYRSRPIIHVWMIISVEEVVKRRHSNKTAPKEGWHVLMTRIGKTPDDKSEVQNGFIKTFTIKPNTFHEWKCLF
jgi:hypothetical protein